MNNQARSVAAFLAGVVALATACGRSEPSADRTEQQGQYGTSWLLTVSRQTGGTVTTVDGKIDCGTVGTRCGPVSYGWHEVATLVATPDDGFMFGTWLGDCAGRTLDATLNGYVCTLDTRLNGADKYAVPVFDVSGRSAHGNFVDPAVHGPAFFDFVQGKPGAFECTYCHGVNYGGVGLAPSCNACHEKNGFPNWRTNCNFCHQAPPPAPHPTVSSDLTGCSRCHATTVDPSGNLIPGGTHMNGKVEGGHPAGYVAPDVHGRDFFETASAATPGCTPCHGATYEEAIVSTPTGDKSCTTCHADNGWTGWQTNCSFCHGAKNATTQAGYAVAAHPTWSAPPDALAQRLGAGAAPARTGAHQLHLTGSAYARAFTCDVCHTVPTSLAHISGRDVRGAVLVKAPGQAAAPDPTAYDPVTRTCATACHGAARSPAWETTGMQCNGCHGVPPATAPHGGLTGDDLTQCAGCHPTTITPAGTVDPNGTHLNGTVDRVDGHAAGFAAPTQHGSQFLDTLGGVAGSTDCKSCHGTSYGLCNSCHSSTASGGWQSWQTNCTFCHGTRTPAYDSTLIQKATPPDAVAERLTGAPQYARTGVHGAHVVQDTTYSPFRCAACHPVPTTFNHVSADRRATVTITAVGAFPNLTATEQAALPNPLATYVPEVGSCTAYCHGSTMQGGTRPTVWWDDESIGDCTSCHGGPPKSGRVVVYAGTISGSSAPPACRVAPGCTLHQLHASYACDNCHTGSAPANGAMLHVSGKADVVYRSSITGTWNATTGTCTASCHASPTTVKTWR